MIQPVTQKSLVEEVVSRIRGVIERGDFSAGDRLPSEHEFVKQLQVSRPVLREAISRLESVGLLTVRRGRGMFVGDRDSLSSCMKLVRSAMAIAPKDLAQFMELRRLIECYAVRQAAERASAEDLAELESLCNQMGREGQENLESMAIDFRFHLKLVELSGNELMVNVMQVVQEYVIALMLQTTLELHSPTAEARRRMHLPILDAVRSGDADAAEVLMREHMEYIEKRLDETEAIRQEEVITVAG